MRALFGASWRTGLLGFLALCTTLIPLLPNVDPKWATFCLSLVTGLGLMFSKDGNVTGGTRPNDNKDNAP